MMKNVTRLTIKTFETIDHDTSFLYQDNDLYLHCLDVQYQLKTMNLQNL